MRAERLHFRIGTTVLILMVIFCNPVSLFFIGTGYQYLQIARVEREMRKPAMYQPVSKALALYCQSDLTRFPPHMDQAWFPEAMSEMKTGYLSLHAQGAALLMGGGFYHYRYILELDQRSSTPDRNVWDLYQGNDSTEEPLHLHRFETDPSETIPIEPILQRVMADLDQQIAKYPSKIRTYRTKIDTLVRFHRYREAQAACKQMAVQSPRVIWPVLIDAMIRSAQGNATEAEILLQDWVKTHPGFTQYMDLAYFYEVQGEPEKAASAIRQAIEFRVSTSPSSWSFEEDADLRGYRAAMFAYNSGSYETTIVLCDHLMTDNVNRMLIYKGFQEIKSTAETLLKTPGAPPELTWDTNIQKYTPLGDLEAFLPLHAQTEAEQ